tara:strand:- start:28 stop:666 length:639 start_codon:yes stop_codon:yes gene_type:complete
LNIQNFSKLGINEIKSSSVLNDLDFKNMNNITNELQRSYEVQQMWRTETEIRYSVLNDSKFPTAASKYWQSIREQMVFYTNLIQASFEYKKAQIELELLKLKLEEKPQNQKQKLDHELIKIEIDQKEFSIMSKRLEAHDRVREILIWEKVKEECKKLQDFDINDVNAHQKESYRLRWESERELAHKTNDAVTFRNSNSSLETMLNDIRKLSV